MERLSIKRAASIAILVIISCVASPYVNSCNEVSFKKPYSPTSAATDTAKTKKQFEVNPLINYYCDRSQRIHPK